MTWEIDNTHSQIGFSVRHMMVARVRGVFNEFEAAVELDEDEPARSHVSARIATASIDTKAADRDTHLRSPDFFDVETHPYMTFESTRVESLRDGAFEVVGDLTIRDVTHEVRLNGEYDGPVVDPWGARRLGVTLSGDIDREAFGLGWNVAIEAGGVLVGRDVKIAIELELTHVASQERESEAVSTAGFTQV